MAAGIERVSDHRGGGQVSETFKGPREDARRHAQEYLHRYPKGGYMTAIASWRECEDGRIEYTMTRLSSAD